MRPLIANALAKIYCDELDTKTEKKRKMEAL